MNRAEMREKLAGLNLLSDEDEKRRFGSAFDVFRGFIGRHPLSVKSHRKVEIFLRNEFEPSGKAIKFGDSYALILNTGIVEFAWVQLEKYYAEIPSLGDETVLGRGTSRLIHISSVGVSMGVLVDLYLMNVIFHEFIHISRGHLDYRANGGDGKYVLGLEYDADCLAASMVYRFIQSNMPMLARCQIISLTLTSLYWPMRTLAFLRDDLGSERESHISFISRIRAVSSKLASIDNINEDGDFPNGDMLSEDIQCTMSALVDMERRFAKTEGIGEESLPVFFSKFLGQSGIPSDLEKAIGQWSEIKDAVLGSNQSSFEDGCLSWSYEVGEFSAFESH